MNPIKLPTLLQSIVAPQVIKSFILQQLDRLPPTTQQVAKECALVGEYFSRHIIYHLNSGKGTDSGHSTDKIDRAFQHLIDAKIIEPIRTQINMSRHAKVKIQIIRKTPIYQISMTSLAPPSHWIWVYSNWILNVKRAAEMESIFGLWGLVW